MPWLVEDLALQLLVCLYQRGQPGCVVIVDASMAADGLHRALFPPCLPPVFVYQGIAGVTLWSSTVPVGQNGHWSTFHKHTRNKWQDTPLSARPASRGRAAGGEEWEINRHQACKWDSCKSTPRTVLEWHCLYGSPRLFPKPCRKTRNR